RLLSFSVPPEYLQRLTFVGGSWNRSDARVTLSTLFICSPESPLLASRNSRICDFTSKMSGNPVRLGSNRARKFPAFGIIIGNINAKNVALVSATVPNIEDIASWIGNKRRNAVFEFAEDFRPCKPTRHVAGVP
ncbi:hypothetical protein B0H13DRAFT_649676, partial [Mycena leptocephala]